MSLLNSLALLVLTNTAFAASQPLPMTFNESFARFESLVRQTRELDSTVRYEVSQAPSLKTEAGRELGTQILYAPPSQTSKYLIVISSGIHGVEAPAGSFISQKLVQDCLKRIDRTQTGVLFLHNMNPWGYQNGRRTNANNVDLNRNCFDHRKPFPGSSVVNPTYDRLSQVLEPRWPYASWPFGMPIEIFVQIMARGVSPMNLESTVARALSGQYNHPKGIYFGGTEVQDECSEAQKRLLAIGSRYRSALHLDIHTGLGEFGINQIMVNDDISDFDYATFQTLFPEKEQSPYRVVRSTGEANTLLTHGDFTRSLCEMVPALQPCLAATAEIGALSGPVTIEALINENSTYHNAKVPPALREQTRKTLRDVFTPVSDPKWVEAVERNVEPFCHAIEEFIRRH